MSDIVSTIDTPNVWRLATPGPAGWSRTARPDDPERFLMISSDCHANEPSTLWAERMDAKYRDRLPRVGNRRLAPLGSAIYRLLMQYRC